MKVRINKLNAKETLYTVILFILSLFHPIFGVIFYVGLLKLVVDNAVEGAIKYIIMISLRDLLSIKVGVSLASLNTVKLMIFIALSLYIVYMSFNCKIKKKNFRIIVSCTIFCSATIIFSFFTGSYPITSAFKCISFGIVFCSMITGITTTKKKIDWREYLVKVLTPIFIMSFLVIPFSSFRLLNDNFQGIFNHVNVCGIMCTVYISCLLLNKPRDTKKLLMQILQILLTLIMQYLTASRTGMLVSLIVIFTSFIFNHHSKIIYITIIFITFSCFTIYIFNDNVHDLVNNTITEYIYKGNENDILASRRSTQEIALDKYEKNPLVGSGFMTPYKEGYIDYSLKMSLNVEPGSIIWSLFGDVGIIGTILFIVFIITIAASGYLQNIYLMFCVFGICSGEMLFFSVNNSISTILYLLLACYISYKE